MANNTIPNDLDAELDALYAAITGRRPFSYNAAADPLYRSYADRYVQNGRMAMRDTMGQSAALTGGYGSSYAQTVGQQQYNEYLRSLSEVLPELYGMAYRRWSDEGEAMQNAYDMAFQRRESRAAEERAAAQAAYQRERDALADKRYAAEAAERAARQSYKQRQDSYQNLVKLISAAGYTPTDAELSAAGLSRASADALAKEYRRAKGLDAPAQKVVWYKSPSSVASSLAGSGKSKTKKSVGTAGTGSGSSSGSGYKGGLSQR